MTDMILQIGKPHRIGKESDAKKMTRRASRFPASPGGVAVLLKAAARLDAGDVNRCLVSRGLRSVQGREQAPDPFCQHYETFTGELPQICGIMTQRGQ